MDNLLGVPFLLAGLFLVVANKSVSEAMVRSNKAVFAGRLQSRGWVTWSRFVNYLVGTAFVAVGGAVVLGLTEFN